VLDGCDGPSDVAALFIFGTVFYGFSLFSYIIWARTHGKEAWKPERLLPP